MLLICRFWTWIFGRPIVATVSLWAFGLWLGPVMATAQTVRPPLASGSNTLSDRDLSQAPKELLGPLRTIVESTPSDAVRILNIGNTKLTISYWDGTGNWHDIPISSAGYEDIRCAACKENINVVFNNGRAEKAARTAIGNAYQLYWSNDQQAWDIIAARR
jgi:hypothetical protein